VERKRSQESDPDDAMKSRVANSPKPVEPELYPWD
jgi:hypothetical protein